MISLRISCRRMSHLAAKFTGRNDVHVVDPQVDLRFLLEDADSLRLSLEERRWKTDLNIVKEKYMNWWQKYEIWKDADKENAGSAKRELREAKDGLLEMLSLPNVIHSVGSKEKEMLKQTKHAEYLCARGLMRIDKELEVCHLVGYPTQVQTSLKNTLLDLFPEYTLFSPSSFARAAILEAVNVNPKEFLQFDDGSSSFPDTYLVGHSLFAFAAPFVRSQFSDKNSWPITLQSSGMAYHTKRNRPNIAYSSQRMKHCIFSMAATVEQNDEFIANTMGKLAAQLDEGWLLDEVKSRTVMGKELKNYESQALVLEDRGLELVRISRIGDYLSRRLNIQGENGFLHTVYVETDISRILARLVDNLIEGKPVAKSLRDVVVA